MAPNRAHHGGPDSGPPVRLDFSTCANALGPAPLVLTALRAVDASPYPDPHYKHLRERLAALHGVTPGRVALAASASEAIQRLTSAWALCARRQLGPSAVAAVRLPSPGYGDYARAALAQGLDLHPHDRPELESQAPTLTWQTWPSSPHGHLPAQQPDQKSAGANRVDQGLNATVLDLAYWPMRLPVQPAPLTDPLGLTALHALTITQPDTLQLWTPNKALGLTGVRGAYLIAPEHPSAALTAVLHTFESLEPSWPLGAHAVALLDAWCSPATQVWRLHTLPQLAVWTQRLHQRLADLGWYPPAAPNEQASPTTPFGVWAPPPCEVDRHAGGAQGLINTVGQRLRSQGIKWRDTASMGLPGHVRLRTLPPQAQDDLLAVLANAPTPPRTAPKSTAKGTATTQLAPCILVLGTTSHAGKSWLATALCRWYARQGLRVRPFKAQNMSNNARVVALKADDPDGGWGEIGSAQYLQALAAGITPDVSMNPVLLKPEADFRSQVLVHGRPDDVLSRLPWRQRASHLAPLALDALQNIRRDCDLVIIEGAGSPAEINLAESDYVNLGTARISQAATLLVCDIDRGGAFAHIVGTQDCLPPDIQALMCGYVLNRFRGDARLLAPGPQRVLERSGLPLLGVLPLWPGHGLPEEDGMTDERRPSACAPLAESDRLIGVVCPPRISNLDEFQPLRHRPGVRLRWVRQPADLVGLDLLVLPGSKAVASDLAWLRAQGLEDGIRAHAAAGRALLGICGGLQMLGQRLIDPHGVDGDALGLGLLPLDTVFARDKLLAHVALRWSPCKGAWQALSGQALVGYEIHHGRTHIRDEASLTQDATCPVLTHPDGTALGWQCGPVLGLYAHGLFENPELLDALLPLPKGAQSSPSLDGIFDAMADFIEHHLGISTLTALQSLAAQPPQDRVRITTLNDESLPPLQKGDEGS